MSMKLLLVASALSLFQSQTMAVRDGYDPKFLGENFEIPLPTFSDNLQADVLQEPSAWLPYIHYSVATNMARRQPICVALNIDQNLRKSTKRGDWSEDSRIGNQYQLNNDYYIYNDWDRGHMARRGTASWGETQQDAQDASDDTMFYTNSCLQHANLNQDEWLFLEDWVNDLQDNDNGKISSFTGPIYGYMDGVKESLTPSGRETAEIPAAFYKIVTIVRKDTKKIRTMAFIMIQNSTTMKDKSGKKTMNLSCYQVSVKMIEEATGLKFHAMLGDTNLIYYKPGSNEGMLSVDCPSTAPSSTISFKPSAVSSTNPSSNPSVFPTVNPSIIPSFIPSGGPSNLPSLPSSVPSASPSSTPSIVPSAGPCLNNRNYRYKLKAKKTCGWIQLTETRRETHCMHIEVHQNCPQTCGVCCDDDPDYNFSTSNGPSRDCAWIAKIQNRRDTWCERWKINSIVKNACPLACNFCFDFIQYKTLKPSGFPTDSPSRSPSNIPSTRPSPQPSNSPSNSPTDRPSVNPSVPSSASPSRLSTPSPTRLDSDDYSQIFIAAACVNASGDERANEWVSVANYSPNTVNLDRWTITDTKRKPLTLSGTLQSGETIRLGPLKSDDGGSLMLSNSGGELRMQDSNNRIVNIVEWTKQAVDGSVQVFAQGQE